MVLRSSDREKPLPGARINLGPAATATASDSPGETKVGRRGRILHLGPPDPTPIPPPRRPDPRTTLAKQRERKAPPPPSRTQAPPPPPPRTQAPPPPKQQPKAPAPPAAPKERLPFDLAAFTAQVRQIELQRTHLRREIEEHERQIREAERSLERRDWPVIGLLTRRSQETLEERLSALVDNLDGLYSQLLDTVVDADFETGSRAQGLFAELARRFDGLQPVSTADRTRAAPPRDGDRLQNRLAQPALDLMTSPTRPLRLQHGHDKELFIFPWFVAVVGRVGGCGVHDVRDLFISARVAPPNGELVVTLPTGFDQAYRFKNAAACQAFVDAFDAYLDTLPPPTIVAAPSPPPTPQPVPAPASGPRVSAVADKPPASDPVRPAPPELKLASVSPMVPPSGGRPVRADVRLVPLPRGLSVTTEDPFTAPEPSAARPVDQPASPAQAAPDAIERVVAPPVPAPEPQQPHPTALAPTAADAAPPPDAGPPVPQDAPRSTVDAVPVTPSITAPPITAPVEPAVAPSEQTTPVLDAEQALEEPRPQPDATAETALTPVAPIAPAAEASPPIPLDASQLTPDTGPPVAEHAIPPEGLAEAPSARAPDHDPIWDQDAGRTVPDEPTAAPVTGQDDVMPAPILIDPSPAALAPVDGAVGPAPEDAPKPVHDPAPAPATPSPPAVRSDAAASPVMPMVAPTQLGNTPRAPVMPPQAPASAAPTAHRREPIVDDDAAHWSEPLSQLHIPVWPPIEQPPATRRLSPDDEAAQHWSEPVSLIQVPAWPPIGAAGATPSAASRASVKLSAAARSTLDALVTGGRAGLHTSTRTVGALAAGTRTGLHTSARLGAAGLAAVTTYIGDVRTSVATRRHQRHAAPAETVSVRVRPSLLSVPPSVASVLSGRAWRWAAALTVIAMAIAATSPWLWRQYSDQWLASTPSVAPALPTTATAPVSAPTPPPAAPSAAVQPKAEIPAPPRPAPRDARPLSGNEIVQLQGRLRALGFNPGPADGVIGPRTVTAAREFQAAHGLAVTGAIDSALFDDVSVAQAKTMKPPATQ
ncbi:peptidoglycan-binding protein [Reyranella sp. CPCC 100927]|uniref:peptidoglycan-binding domain-containing protein n=1 Tax=Reyranella sp. CPCC 100927 TaxID=2599616 RepID=UPI0011B6A60D|nr:peptidoglycan-binding domain-containing protein [Reyranella sp. CPCC 100927]TWT05979.1 hypothetical protein FQU96_23285 [Reyranella sp. CPCC 100927]